MHGHFPGEMRGTMGNIKPLVSFRGSLSSHPHIFLSPQLHPVAPTTALRWRDGSSDRQQFTEEEANVVNKHEGGKTATLLIIRNMQIKALGELSLYDS